MPWQSGLSHQLFANAAKAAVALNLLSDFPMMAIAFDRVSEQEVARASTILPFALYHFYLRWGWSVPSSTSSILG